MLIFPGNISFCAPAVTKIFEKMNVLADVQTIAQPLSHFTICSDRSSNWVVHKLSTIASGYQAPPFLAVPQKQLIDVLYFYFFTIWIFSYLLKRPSNNKLAYFCMKMSNYSNKTKTILCKHNSKNHLPRWIMIWLLVRMACKAKQQTISLPIRQQQNRKPVATNTMVSLWIAQRNWTMKIVHLNGGMCQWMC